MMVATTPSLVGGGSRELTSFVGRRRELNELKQALSSTALLTITGAAGVGKTRLALRLGEDLANRTPDGVWLVELAELAEAALLTQTVARSVGLRDSSKRWEVEILVEFLASQRIDIILDNCEHLRDACAVLVDSLLRACPNLRIVCTSRVPLGVDGETVVDLAPLPVPDEERPVRAEALMGFDVVRLFVERARAAWPGFDLDDSNAQDVARLCHRLDGLPLAIELAAVRLRAFTPRQILEQIDRRIGFLSRGGGVGHPRHQSLRSAIEWSFGLLSDDERVLFRDLSVFPYDFDLAAAEAICGIDLSREDIADLLGALVDKSLVRRSIVDGVSRFRMLETVRDYARELLVDSGELPRLAAAHRDWYVALSSRVFKGSWGPAQLVMWDRAHIELSNMREIMRRCAAGEDKPVQGQAMAANLLYYWLTKGSLAEGRRWLDALLDATPEAGKERAMALAVNGWLAVVQGDLGRALELHTAGERLASDVGDPVAVSLTSLALTADLMWAGQFDKAETLLDRCLGLRERVGSDRDAANALAARASIAGLKGDRARCFDLYQLAVDMCREAGDRYFLTWALQGQGHAAWDLGDMERAGSLAAETIRISREVDNHISIANAMELTAWVFSATARSEEAARLLGGVEKVWVAIRAALYPHLRPAHESVVTALAASMGEKRFRKLSQEGSDLSVEELMALALGEEPISATRSSQSPLVTRLTRREQEVARLVAEGVSNKEIASRLFISPRTAETHVEHILTKLGFTSRVQIAAWVIENRSAAPRGS